MLEQPHETVMVIAETAGHDMRRYNKPKQYEPAVVFRSHNGTPPTDRDIAVWPRDPNYKTYRISDKCEHVDPLAYPLLFSHGEPGWHPHLQHDGVSNCFEHPFDVHPILRLPTDVALV